MAASTRGTSSRACIVGIGETTYTARGGIKDRGELALACEAVLKAAADAGLAPAAIDGLVSFANDSSVPWLMQESLGLPDLRFGSMVWGGGGGGCYAAIAHAASAVESGAASHVAVFRSLCQGQGQRYGQGYDVPHGPGFLDPFGMFSPPLMLSPLAQRYKHDYGIRDEQAAAVALAFRDNASRNPRAVFHDRPLTLDQYLSARKITEPFRLYDCCQENDGACAVIVTTHERARDLAGKAVSILAAGQGAEPGWGSGGLGSHNMPEEFYRSGGGSHLARRLYGEAGIGPQDVDTAQIYDHFSYFVLMNLETFGFCGRGEAGQFAAGGHIAWPNGSLPLNTAGGHLSEAYIHGLNLAVEGVRQLRGSSTSQVEDAEICLLANSASAAILGRAP
jgi:acetyl-CoA acetyltransferase